MVCYLFLTSVTMKCHVTELKERHCLLRCFFLVFLSCIVFWKSIVSFLLIDSNSFYRYRASYFLQIVSVLTGHILIHLTILSTLRKAWLLTLLNFLLHYSLFFFFLSFVLGCIASFSTFLLYCFFLDTVLEEKPLFFLHSVELVATDNTLIVYYFHSQLFKLWIMLSSLLASEECIIIMLPVRKLFKVFCRPG